MNVTSYQFKIQTMMKLQLYMMDAFASGNMKGNPAAVCPLDTWLDDSILQHIAQENNQSETAFLVRNGTHFDIRWFTPTTEVDLCGHATLASASVIYNFLGYSGPMIRFNSKSGELDITRNNDLITLNFPIIQVNKMDPTPDLINGLGKTPKEIYKATDILAVFEDEADIIDIKPNLYLLEKLNARGIVVTAKGHDADFVSRFFGPAVGIPEDPVTGSAHSMLVPYWASKLNKTKFHALQLSKRGGELFCELANNRVLISGKANLYMKGEIYIQ
jgi:PhzF family phenazine biosynthesis protein